MSIASCERLFSKLKLILNYLLSSMSQERLTASAQKTNKKNIEWKTFKELKFDNVINDFVTQKAQRQIYKMIIK